MEYDHLILSSVSDYNKQRPLSFSDSIFNENPDSVIYFLPMHGERLSLRPEPSGSQAAAKRKHVEEPNYSSRQKGAMGCP